MSFDNIFFLKKKNNAGRLTPNHKKILNSKSRLKGNILNYFKGITPIGLNIILKFKNNKKKRKILIKSYNGITYLYPAISGVFLGDFINFLYVLIKKTNMLLGNNSYLFLVPLFTIISNIRINKNFKLSSSNGVSSRIILKIYDFNICLVMLPSKKKKKINLFSTCFLGKNILNMWKYRVLGNFKNSFILNQRQSVRGVAMNPVDHPHGGRTKTNKPEVSPWGWIAKHSH